MAAVPRLQGAPAMSGPNIICSCGKPFIDMEALRKHQKALGHENARVRKRRERQRRLRRIARAAAG